MKYSPEFIGCLNKYQPTTYTALFSPIKACCYFPALLFLPFDPSVSMYAGLAPLS